MSDRRRRFSRREALAGLAGLAGAVTAAEAQQTPAPADITSADLAILTRIEGLGYSDAERALMVRSRRSTTSPATLRTARSSPIPVSLNSASNKRQE